MELVYLKERRENTANGASLPEGTAGECRFVDGLTDPSLAGGIRN